MTDDSPFIPVCGLTTAFQPAAPTHGATNGSAPAPQAGSAAQATQSAAPGGAAPQAPRMRPNRLVWRGRLAQDPEVQRSRSGVDFCVIRVLQTVLDTHRQPVTQGIDIVTFRERAHDVARLFRKGDLVEVWGELRIRTRQDQQGIWHTDVSVHPDEPIALISRARPA